ncbi:MAG: VWA domain-containing protein [Acidobacteria bacterium]|nr:VWA domain-containing protein [Acidobacteriota bacterium]
MRHRWLKGLPAAVAITLAAAAILGAQDPASLQGDNPPAGAIRVDRLDVGYVPVRRPRADLAPGQATGQQAMQTPTFRSAVELIPVNVSVLGPDGRPVVDLKKANFTILEDGIPQEVQHFSLESIVAETSKASANEAVGRRIVPALELAPQERRVFLIVLSTWRGNSIQGPNKGLDALLDFVNKRLLPQDVVAATAYNRATVFTTNHAAIVEVIERYRARSDKIGAALEAFFSGLRALFGTGRIPADTQRDIDEVFDVPGASMRQLPAIDARPMRSNATPPRPNPDAAAALEDYAKAEAGFDQRVASSLTSMGGMAQIFAGVDYMRTMVGQKRLVYFGPGMAVPSTDDDHSIAAMANDARVALDMIQTGGIEGFSMWRGTLGESPGFGESFNFASMRSLSRQTGGQASITEFTRTALDRVDVATRTQYLLGYYPKNTNWNGKYRRIEVRVNRPDLDVVWRQGYYARQTATPYDAKEFLTVTRIATAAQYRVAVTDIKMKAALLGNDVTLTIDISRVALKQVDGRRVGQLRVAAFYGDARQRIIDVSWSTLDLNFTDEAFSRFLKTGIEYRWKVPATLEPTYMRVIVYNYDVDLLGTLETKLR